LKIYLCRHYMDSFSWREARKNIPYLITLFITLTCLFLIAFYAGGYFDFIELRNGPQLNDFIFKLLPAHDVSWILFLFLYSGVAIGLYSVRNDPRGLLLTFQTYVLVTLLRVLTIYLFPLNPPNDYIPLREPVAQFFAHDHKMISHDLFFSGHVSTICSLLFSVKKGWVKKYILICAIAISVLVLVQRVHYTIDVIVAPLATYCCYWFSVYTFHFAVNRHGKL